MRRTRDNNWQFFLFLLPAIAAGFGVHYMMKKNKTITVATTTPTEMTRTANLTGDATEERSNTKFGHKLTEKVAQMTEEATADQDDPEQDLAVEKKSRAPASVVETNAKTPSAVAPAAKPAAVAVTTATEDKTCTSFELRGDGMNETHVSNEEWTQVMGLFHQSKAELQGWLVSHNSELPGGLVKWMSEQVNNAKLQRPPLAEEPDLNWRGIGVAVHKGETASPLLRVGGGFVKMSVTEPQRAHFELTRLLAQSWSPCDMPTGARATWQPLLKCMGLKEQEWDAKKSCANGSQSEAGWAVASAVAAKVTPPGCVLPAFQNAAVFQCVQKTAWFDYPKADVGKVAEVVVPVVAKPEAKTEAKAENKVDEKSVARFTGKPEAKEKAEAEEVKPVSESKTESKASAPVVRTPASLPPNASLNAPATISNSNGGKNE